MHDELWAGADLKAQYARFHFTKMAEVIQPWERTAINAARQSSGAILDTGWQISIYAYFDAFLSVARSIPEIIQCCFGVDYGGPMKEWFGNLPDQEQARRHEFKRQYKTHYETFRALPLGMARHISEHRQGYPPVTVTVNGRFGVTYTGGPAKGIPTIETPEISKEFPWMNQSSELRPMWPNFAIDGRPLFDECRNYLEAASTLINAARAISDAVHGTESLTPPLT